MRIQSLPLAGIVALTLIVSAAPARGQSTAAGEAVASDSQAFRQTFVIRRPGSYVLPNDRVIGDITGIEITADDVTLDLGGHSVLGPGGLGGVGIAVRGDNVRVLNGHIQNVGIGVLVENATNVVIEDLKIDGLDLGGAPPDVEIGILLVDTRGARVTGNVITDTFLGVFVRGEESGGNRISGNLIVGGANGQLAICYNPAPGASAGGPDGDLVEDNVISHFHQGMAFSADSAGNVVRGNTVAFFDLGIVEATMGSNVMEENVEVEIAP
jgi:nitrous oxidase accessory protein NosD